MKFPFAILTVLFLLLGAPLGFMQYHSRAAFIETPTNSSFGMPPGPQFGWRTIDCWHAAGGLLAESTSSQVAAFDLPIGTAGESCTWYETKRAKWFAACSPTEKDYRLAAATANAIVNSWTIWQPAFEALSECAADLSDRDYLVVWRQLQQHAVLPETADDNETAGDDETADDNETAGDDDEGEGPRSLASVISPHRESHYPKCLADQRRPAAIPGLVAATAAAIVRSGRTCQPTLAALSQQLKEIRKPDCLTSWQKSLKKRPAATNSVAVRMNEVRLQGLVYSNSIRKSIASGLASFYASHRPNCLAFRRKPAVMPSLMAATGQAIGKSWTVWQKTLVALPVSLGKLCRQALMEKPYGRFERNAAAHFTAATSGLPICESDSATMGRTIVASLTPLPSNAAEVLETVNFPSGLGIVANAPIGQAVADFLGSLPRPMPRMTRLAGHAVWLPTLLRQLWRE
jgi:hypothetical protein